MNLSGLVIPNEIYLQDVTDLNLIQPHLNTILCAGRLHIHTQVRSACAARGTFTTSPEDEVDNLATRLADAAPCDWLYNRQPTTSCRCRHRSLSAVRRGAAKVT